MREPISLFQRNYADEGAQNEHQHEHVEDARNEDEQQQGAL